MDITPSGSERALAILNAELECTVSARELIDLVGEMATAILCGRLGGMRIAVTGWRPILEVFVGVEATDVLEQHFGSQRIELPRRALSPKGRRSLVYRLADEDYNRTEIALKADLSERQVYRLLADRDHEDDVGLCGLACETS